MIGNVIWFVAVEPVTGNQVVPRPVVRELVCACKVQPRWLAGQARVRFAPVTVQMRFVGVGETALFTTSVPVV